MSDDILRIVLQKVENMEYKILNAQSMNGGFDKLMMEVTHIKEVQDDILNGIKGVKKTLYEPDSGLFSRVKEMETESARRLEFVKESKPALEFAKELQVWKIQADKDLEEVENLKIEVAKLQDWKSSTQKVMWLLITAAGGLWAKYLADVLLP
jgi:hypothetical protein|tara:strand:+ start:2531 stop:2989 length:459 start_codon:yes stop_codon:yes gene_type:complete